MGEREKKRRRNHVNVRSAAQSGQQQPRRIGDWGGGKEEVGIEG